ncbi:MAG: hypothetical protein KDD45_02605 [Bdellovibrionales bacterium]|nr:hypothetical protein [Bdellovibrionales bacterium]
MDQSKRIEFVKVIGFSSAYKYLGQGYILGGYDGVEVSVSAENVPFSKTNYLSQTSIDESDRLLQSVVFGKGLFHNIDIFFSFSPFIIQNEISNYGMALRYIFYQDEIRPLNIGVFLYGNGINISNLVGIQTTGIDLILNYYKDYWTLYLGMGMARSLGSFVGGTNGVTSDQNSADEDLSQNRFYGGVSYNFGSYSLTAELGRVYEQTFAIKLGTRF